MNKEAKKAVLKSFCKGLISKEEVKILINWKMDNLLFKTLIYPNGESENLGPGNHLFLPLLEKLEIEFIHIK